MVLAILFGLSIIILTKLPIFNFAQGLDLHCLFDYSDKKSSYGRHYACIAQNLSTNLTDGTIRNVQQFGSQQAPEENKESVEEFFVEKGDCFVLPKNLSGNFGNLKIYIVKNSNVRNLTKGDLDGLKKLEVFDVSHNHHIEVLPSGFFDGLLNLKKISFDSCNLKFIDCSVFDEFPNSGPIEVNFNNNHCTNYTTPGLPWPIQTVQDKIKNCNTPISSNYDTVTTEKTLNHSSSAFNANSLTNETANDTLFAHAFESFQIFIKDYLTIILSVLLLDTISCFIISLYLIHK